MARATHPHFLLVVDGSYPGSTMHRDKAWSIRHCRRPGRRTDGIIIATQGRVRTDMGEWLHALEGSSFDGEPLSDAIYYFSF